MKLESLKSKKFEPLTKNQMEHVRGGTTIEYKQSEAKVNGSLTCVTDRKVDNTCWEYCINGVWV